MKRTKRLLLCCFGILLVAGWQTVVADDSETWMSGVPTVHSYAIDSTQNKICRQVSDIRAMNPSYPDGVTVDGCLYEGLYLDLLKTNGLQGSRLYVKFSNEQYFRALDADMSSYLVPGTDMLVLKTVRGSEPTQVAMYRSLSDALQPQTYNSENVVTRYNLDSSQSTRVLPETAPSLQNHLVYNEAFSANGKYMIAYVDREGYVKINLETMTTTIIAHARTDWSSGTPPRAAAISRDGRYALIDNGAKIVDTSGCGDAFGSGFIRNNMEHPCDVNELTNYIQRSAGYFARGENYAFTDQDRSIEFDMYESGIYEPHHVRIDQPGYVRDTTRLEYLALGDSYSSGEGDIEVNSEGMKFYLPLTDIDEDNCHLSSRSYPFLLRDAWGLYPEQMKSVACSGARVVYDYNRPLEGYFGQDNRTRNKTDIDNVQKTALDRFIPGWIPQLEFVKKYQPKVITVTGGGNDIGFADVLRYCAETYSVCGYASDTNMRRSLDAYIDDQYVYSRRLIEQIKEYSAETNVYVIGYPKFLADDIGVCVLNSGLLSTSEINMVNDSVTRLNIVLKRAAHDTGVIYINLEDSLEDGRMCEGSKYITGVVDVGGNLESKDMFHPNSMGHAKMAEVIIREIADNTISEGASISESTDFNGKMIKQKMTDDIMVTSHEYQITVPAHTFKRNSMSRVVLQSETVELGDVNVLHDGSIDSSVSIPPTLPPGFHLLRMIGSSQSGEYLEIQQFVTIASPSSRDKDGDGINDETDPCLFIRQWFNEKGDDICVSSTEARESETTEVRVTNVISGANSKEENDEKALQLPGVKNAVPSPILKEIPLSSNHSSSIATTKSEGVLISIQLIVISILIISVMAGIIYLWQRR